jgi:hypothetical protein
MRSYFLRANVFCPLCKAPYYVVAPKEEVVEAAVGELDSIV